MQCELTHQANYSEAKLSGKFTFHDNEAFRQMMNDVIRVKPAKLVLMLAEADYIDSSALGMLLLMRESFESHNIVLELKKPQGQIAMMFDISKFDELFIITH